jgi:hypothetical protein
MASTFRSWLQSANVFSPLLRAASTRLTALAAMMMTPS